MMLLLIVTNILWFGCGCWFHVLHHMYVDVGEFEVWPTRQPVARRLQKEHHSLRNCINNDVSGLMGMLVWAALKAVQCSGHTLARREPFIRQSFSPLTTFRSGAQKLPMASFWDPHSMRNWKHMQIGFFAEFGPDWVFKSFCRCSSRQLRRREWESVGIWGMRGRREGVGGGEEAVNGGYERKRLTGGRRAEPAQLQLPARVG